MHACVQKVYQASGFSLIAYFSTMLVHLFGLTMGFNYSYRQPDVAPARHPQRRKRVGRRLEVVRRHPARPGQIQGFHDLLARLADNVLFLRLKWPLSAIFILDHHHFCIIVHY